jgi:DNA-binding GntR family transcriptional regulator
VVLAFKGSGRDNLCSNDEHGDIVEAIAAGHAPKAVDAMTRHLQNLEDQLDLSVTGEPRTDLARLFADAVD